MEPRSKVNPRRAVMDLIGPDSVGAEIGVHEGDFSLVLVNELAPEQLHLIDPWIAFDDAAYARSHYGSRVTQADMDQRYQRVADRLADHVDSGVIRIHRSMSAEAASEFPDEYFDFIYIDGDHSYNGVVADLEAYYPKVKTGGLIVGDDYRLRAWWADGVVRAFHELLVSKPAVIELKWGTQIVVRKVTREDLEAVRAVGDER